MAVDYCEYNIIFSFLEALLSLAKNGEEGRRLANEIVPGLLSALTQILRRHCRMLLSIHSSYFLIHCIWFWMDQFESNWGDLQSGVGSLHQSESSSIRVTQLCREKTQILQRGRGHDVFRSGAGSSSKGGRSDEGNAKGKYDEEQSKGKPKGKPYDEEASKGKPKGKPYDEEASKGKPKGKPYDEEAWKGYAKGKQYGEELKGYAKGKQYDENYIKGKGQGKPPPDDWQKGKGYGFYGKGYDDDDRGYQYGYDRYEGKGNPPAKGRDYWKYMNNWIRVINNWNKLQHWVSIGLWFMILSLPWAWALMYNSAVVQRHPFVWLLAFCQLNHHTNYSKWSDHP